MPSSSRVLCWIKQSRSLETSNDEPFVVGPVSQNRPLGPLTPLWLPGAQGGEGSAGVTQPAEDDKDRNLEPAWP